MTKKQYEQLVKNINNEYLSNINQTLLEFLANGQFLDNRLNSSRFHADHSELKKQKETLRQELYNYIETHKNSISAEYIDEITKNF